MGINTKGYILSTNSLTDIINAIKKLEYAILEDNDVFNFIREFSTVKSGQSYFGQLSFTSSLDEHKHRILSIYLSTYSGDVPNMYVLSFGFWGKSEKIMRDIVSQFGGIVLDSDCDSDYEFIPKSKGK